MGLLVEGKPLPSEELKSKLQYIREHGVMQFLHTWRRSKDLKDDELKFGDEIECGIFVVDHENKTVKLSVRAAEIRDALIEKENFFQHESEGATWHPEYGAWMVESTPSRPYQGYSSDLLRVETNMLLRRRRLLSALHENEIAPTVTNFALLGAGDFIHNPKPFSAPASESKYIPDYIINPHPRFAALTRNIRMRRGQKVDIQVPLYHDKETPEFLSNESKTTAGVELEGDTNIHMDAMAFGMGMCCLQVTFQARDVDESRYMYDNLAVLAPIMLAMTAATPIFKGRLSDFDARWTVIAQSVDDRTPAERGLLSDSDREAARDHQMAGDGVRSIPKSRYDSISTYIYHCNGEATCERTFAQYNDLSCPVDEDTKSRLRADGVDENLAHHIAHLFIRDPLVAYAGQIEELDDEKSTDHFESIQSTNWQTCRWKPPPPTHSADSPHIGWRTEFRSMEVQLTDFENAAFTVFIVLVTRVLLAFDLGFYLPLSNVDENMRRAHLRDAARTQKFFFRKHIAPPEVTLTPAKKDSSDELDQTGHLEQVASKLEETEKSSGSCGGCAETSSNSNSSGKEQRWSSEDSYEEMTMEEIFLGKSDYFPGLLPLVYAYLDFINCDAQTYRRVSQYLQFIEKRATGQLITPATWMRRFVQSHPDYKHDSVISPSIAHDLMQRCHDIGVGAVACPELHGDIAIERVRKEDAYGRMLAGRLSHQERGELVKTLISRAKVERPSTVARGKLRTYSNLSNMSNHSYLDIIGASHP